MDYSPTDTCLSIDSMTQSFDPKASIGHIPKCQSNPYQKQLVFNPTTTFYNETPSKGFEIREDSDTTTSAASMYPHLSLYLDTLSQIKKELQTLKKNQNSIIRLSVLKTKRLHTPIDVILEPDEEGFIARSVDLPLFGYGEDQIEAVDALKFEIESLYEDLSEEDDFTDEWLPIKQFFDAIIITS